MKLKEFQKLLNNKNILLKNHKIITLKTLYKFIKNKNKIKLYEFEFRKILDLLLYDFSSYDIIKRLEKIKSIGKSTTKKSMIIRYGEIEGKKRYKIKIEKVKYTSSRKYLIEKYKDENIVNDILKNRCPNNKKLLKIKYPLNWEEKYEQYMKSYKFSNSEEGYIKKYGEIEGVKKWEQRKINRKISNSEEGYINKYGKVEGAKKWKQKSEKHSYRLSKQYYIDTYGTKLGSIISRDNSLYYKLKRKHGDEWFKDFLIQKQKRAKKNKIGSRDFFIKKYGEIEGGKKWDIYIEKQKYAHTIDYYINKYGESEGQIKYKQYRKRIINNFINSNNGVSKVSQKLFLKIQNKLNLTNCMFHEFNNEFYINDKKNKMLFYYDFKNENKIIEFNGDFWHMNPATHKNEDINKLSKKTAQEIWEYDKVKNNKAKNKGFDILIIWESDYYKNENEIFNKCINFLTS